MKKKIRKREREREREREITFLCSKIINRMREKIANL